MGRSDVEAPGPSYDFSSFEDKALRRGFIRKVFAILCAQLTLVTGEWFAESTGARGLVASTGAPYLEFTEEYCVMMMKVYLGSR